jgi:hypothetical protein
MNLYDDQNFNFQEAAMGFLGPPHGLNKPEQGKDSKRKLTVQSHPRCLKGLTNCEGLVTSDLCERRSLLYCERLRPFWPRPEWLKYQLSVVTFS